MPLTAEQKKGLSADVLQEIENDEKENARLNRENGEKRTRANEIEREPNFRPGFRAVAEAAVQALIVARDLNHARALPQLIERARA